MEIKIDENVLGQYNLKANHITLKQIGSGHINRTYLLTNLTSNEKFVVQSINANVFTDPNIIDTNIQLVAEYLKKHFPNYLFPAPIATISGTTMVHYENEFWRMSKFVDNTIAFDTLTSPTQAYEAAKQFGKLSRLLDGFDSYKLRPAIVGFHDLKLRYQQFEQALKNSSGDFLASAKNVIALAIGNQNILNQFETYTQRNDFPDRVMHHDTKISNVLLEEHSFKGACVIDLDTLMPGKFISDLGDMMRTYLCAFSENETDLSKIKIRLPYFEAMIKGYLSEMSTILTETEKELILFSGKYIIYMQGLRFLTDYLNGSVYYPIKYAEQNLDRTKNQFKLLSEFFENEKTLQDIIEECLLATA